MRHTEEVAARMQRLKEKEKKEYQTYSEKLPSYFYNINGRHGLNYKLERSLRETATITSDMKNDYTSFGMKSFRAQDKKSARGVPKQSKFF
jgi:hypothetical protein